jgi:hypothetical protein
LGVDTNGWTVISSDPGGDQLPAACPCWDAANAELAVSGGGSKNYDALNVGDPDTNGGVAAFPKNTPGDNDDYVLKATGTLVVPADGTYAIGFNSDDGAYVKIAGQTFLEVQQNNTGLSAITGDTVTCDCLTGDSGTITTITLKKGTYPIEAGMFERGGGSFLRVSGATVGTAPLNTSDLPTLAKNGAGTAFKTLEALHLTSAPTGTGGGGTGTTLTITRTGNSISIAWTPTGGTLQSTSALTGATTAWTDVGTANPASVTVSTTGTKFYRVKNP